MVVEAGLEGPLPVLLPPVAAQRDQARAVVQLRADLSSDLVAIDPGQADIDQHGFRLELYRLLHAGDTIGGLMDLVSGGLEQDPHHLPTVGVVLDHQDSPARHAAQRYDRRGVGLRRVDQRGETDGEHAAAPLPRAARLDSTPVTLDEAAHEGETDPQPSGPAIDAPVALNEQVEH